MYKLQVIKQMPLPQQTSLKKNAKLQAYLNF